MGESAELLDQPYLQHGLLPIYKMRNIAHIFSNQWADSHFRLQVLRQITHLAVCQSIHKAFMEVVPIVRPAAAGLEQKR